MNVYYHYAYTKGLQFVSTANLTPLTLALMKKNSEIPKLIGVWRFKNLKNKNK